jgi:hypothetical protein
MIRGRRTFIALVLQGLYASLLCGSGQPAPVAAANTTEVYPNVLNLKTIAQELPRVATVNKELIFTTFALWGDAESILNATRNFMVFLARVGRAQNTLLITKDTDSCRKTLEEGMPCWLDQASPWGTELPAGHRYR